jgi:oligoendopeptidase F
MNPSADIKKIDRQFIPNNFIVTNWEALQPFFDELVVREIASLLALE